MALRKNRSSSTNSGTAVPVDRSANSLSGQSRSGSSGEDIWAAILESLKNKSHLDRLNDRPNVGSETDANVSLLNSLNSGNGLNENIASWIDLMSQGGYFTEEIRDQLRQFLFQMLLNQDQRQFDLQQLADSRLYNSPTNELARIMGAGISRDAAIQMLSGSIGGGSAGAGVAGSAGVTAPSVPQTSGTQDLQRTQVAIGGIGEIINAFCNLLNTGVGFAQGLEQVKSMRASNFFNEQQVQAYKSVQDISTMVQKLNLAGVIPDADLDNLSTAEQFSRYLRNLAKNNDQVAQVVSSPSFENALGTPAGRSMYNDYWKSVRDTRDQGVLFDEYIKQQRLQNVVKGLEGDKIGAEMALIGQQQKESEQNVIESCSRVALNNATVYVKNEEGKWIAQQRENSIRMTDSQVNLIDTQAYGASIENDMLSLNYELNSAGFPMLKQTRIDELQYNLDHWTTIMNPDLRVKQIRAWLNERENAFDAAYLQQIQQNAVGDFAKNYPTLWLLAQGFKYAGVNELVSATAGAAGAGVGSYQAGKAVWNMLPGTPKIP